MHNLAEKKHKNKKNKKKITNGENHDQQELYLLRAKHIDMCEKLDTWTEACTMGQKITQKCKGDVPTTSQTAVANESKNPT